MSIQENLFNFKDKILNDYSNGKGMALLGREYGCNSGTIWFFLKSQGIKTKERSKEYGISDQNLPQIKELFDKGLSGYAIAKQLGLSKNLVQRVLKKHGYSTSEKSTARKDPLKNHLKDITSMYESGISMCKIADKYNASDVSILDILKDHNIKRRPIAIYTYDETLFNKIDTEAKAEVLGFFYADGNCKQNHKGIRLEICDLEILEKFKEVFKYTGPIHNKGRKSDKHQIQYSLNINSKKLALQFDKLGCPPAKTFKIKFPDESIVPNYLIHHFCRGYFEGDGHIGCYKKNSKNKNYWQVSILGTRHLLDGIEKASGIIGHFSQRFPERGKDNWTLSINRKDNMSKFLNWIYKDATLFLKRKYDKYLQFLEETKEQEIESEIKENTNSSLIAFSAE